MLFLVGFFGKSKLCPCSALVFWHIVVFFLLTGCHRGEPQGVGSSKTIVALVGEDVILPYHLEPAVDAVSKSLEWSRPDLEPRFVHVWHDSQDLLDNQNPTYKGRTSVSTEKLRRGDLSLSLSAVKPSDNGIYRCYSPLQDKEFTVELVAGSFSLPVISHVSKDSNGVVLQCEAKDWYPEPEVLWQDDKGKVLSAGPEEMTKGPDDLLTVRSKVTLKKSDDEIFTCRVHQKTINQTRETHIQISADFFDTSSCVAAHVSITVVVLLGVIVAAAFIFWKRRQNQTKVALPQNEEGNENLLTPDEQKIKDLEKKNRKLEEDFEKALKEKKGKLEEEFEKDFKEKKRTLEEEFEKALKEKKGTLEEKFDKALKEKRTLEEKFEKAFKEKKGKLEEEFEKDFKEKKRTLEEEFEKDFKEKKRTLEEKFDKALKEKRTLEEKFEKALKEKRTLEEKFDKALKEKRTLEEKFEKALREKKGKLEEEFELCKMRLLE